MPSTTSSNDDVASVASTASNTDRSKQNELLEARRREEIDAERLALPRQQQALASALAAVVAARRASLSDDVHHSLDTAAKLLELSRCAH